MCCCRGGPAEVGRAAQNGAPIRRRGGRCSGRRGVGGRSEDGCVAGAARATAASSLPCVSAGAAASTASAAADPCHAAGQTTPPLAEPTVAAAAPPVTATAAVHGDGSVEQRSPPPLAVRRRRRRHRRHYCSRPSHDPVLVALPIALARATLLTAGKRHLTRFTACSLDPAHTFRATVRVVSAACSFSVSAVTVAAAAAGDVKPVATVRAALAFVAGAGVTTFRLGRFGAPAERPVTRFNPQLLQENLTQPHPPLPFPTCLPFYPLPSIIPLRPSASPRSRGLTAIARHTEHPTGSQQ
jgi:hypothetical protein